jgi:hypothetical protein
VFGPYGVGLCPFKFDGIEHLPEFLAGHKARQETANLPGAHSLGIFNTFGAGLQPKIAKIAQFDDVAARQFIRNNGQHTFEHGHHIRSGDGAGLGNALGQLAQAYPASG